MINIEVGDILFFSNGQKMRVLKFGDRFLFVGVKDWEVYLELNDIDHIYDFSHDNGIYIEDIIKAREVTIVRSI